MSGLGELKPGGEIRADGDVEPDRRVVIYLHVDEGNYVVAMVSRGKQAETVKPGD